MKLGHFAVLALLAATAPAPEPADLTLRFGTPFVTNSNLHKAMEKVAEVVAQDSSGKIKVQVAVLVLTIVFPPITTWLPTQIK
jgi:TRAP-type C4-dicarboxylate transport system substrate-binding protein